MLPFHKKFTKELFFCGLKPAEFRQVLRPVSEDNRKAAIVWAATSSIFWILSLLLSLNTSAYAACRLVYIVALTGSILVLLWALFVVPKLPRTLYPTMYLLEITLLSAGIGIAACQPDVRTCTMIAAVIIVPVCFIERTIISVLLNTATIVFYAFLTKSCIKPEIYSWGLTNLLLFSFAGLMIGHVINKTRFERYLYADSAEKLARIQMHYAYYDQMTELKNRRAYSEETDRLRENMPDELCLLVADVNGLKVVNDTMGHDAGDELIKSAAECLRIAFEGVGTLYRIGGDEFCILAQGQKEQMKQGMIRLEEMTRTGKGTLLKRISISYGMSTGGKDSDFDSLFQEADQQMYEYKRNYYITHKQEQRRT
ncbi:MAG: GGDEF domain-containing protein [Oscillospiraceae bacterium]|nr:GGDEF domain-containing protein [Oscillospiraceae bacterium]